jgi:RHS repeat-associated protein
MMRSEVRASISRSTSFGVAAYLAWLCALSGAGVVAGCSGKAPDPTPGPAPASTAGRTEVRRSALSSDVTVTVLDGDGHGMADRGVAAIDSSGDAVAWGNTDEIGQATLSVDPDTYQFQVTAGGTYFLSDACTVPGCTAATVQISKPVLVTVTNADGAPLAAVPLVAIDADGNEAGWNDTDDLGTAAEYLLPGAYMFRAVVGGGYFESGPPGHCVVPGCAAALISVTDVVVTVTDASGLPLAGENVTALASGGVWAADAVTDAQGRADVFVSAGAYSFRAIIDGNYFDSGPDGHCVVPGCRKASIGVPAPVTVTVVNGAGQPVANQAVQARDSNGYGPDGTTDAQGHVTFTLPPGGWRFSASCGAESFVSGDPGSCVVPGCTAARLTMICGACAGRPNGTACDDGNACTQTDICSDGTCLGTNPVGCPAGDQCHDDGVCVASTGLCTNPVKDDGTACDDGNASTHGETCQAGVCRAPSLSAGAPPSVEDIGTLGGSFVSPVAINASGQVTGVARTASGSNHAFLRTATGSMIDLGAKPGFPADSGGDAINDAGDVAGLLTETDGWHAFRYKTWGGLDDLGLGGDGSTFTDSIQYQGAQAFGINNGGQVAGLFTNGGMLRGFRYTDGVGFEDIGSLQGGKTVASSIDDSGTVVGASWVAGSPTTGPGRAGHGVLYKDHTVGLVDLNTYVDQASGWTLYGATNIVGNYVVGSGDHNGIQRPYRINLSTGSVDEISGGWAGKSVGAGTNMWGAVVGWGYLDAGSTQQAAFVYTDQLGFKRLNDLLDPESGWDLRVASAINVSGEIVGTGVHNGQPAAFLLRLPSAGAISCAGKPDGTPCDDGNPCTQVDLCTAGTCQGTNPYTCGALDSCEDTGTCNTAAPPPAPPSTKDLVGWWKLDGDGRDSSGFGHDLKVEGNVVPAQGRVGLGMHFDGASCMTAPIWKEARMQGASGVTMMAWIKPTEGFVCPSGQTALAVMGRGWDYSLGGWCYPTPGDASTGGVRVAGAQTWGYPGGWGTVTPSQWTHVAVTWDHNNIAIYFNGKGVISYPDPGNFGDIESTFAIGCMISQYFTGDQRIMNYSGTIDEAMLYSRVLSPQEIWSNFAGADPCSHTFLADGASCTDNNLCTQGDTCHSGLCVGGAPVTCTAPDACHDAPTCYYWTGCWIPPNKPDGTACDDGNVCTQSETCQAGSCQAPAGTPTILNLPVEALGGLGGTYASGQDIDSGGDIVGSATTPSGEARAFYRPANGLMQDIVGGPSDASDVNDAGMVTGSMTVSGVSHAFRWSAATSLQDLGVVGDGQPSTEDQGVSLQGAWGKAINKFGQVAGTYTNGGAIRGFRYTETQNAPFEDIGSLAGGMTRVFDMDINGTVVGSSWVPGTPAVNDVRRLGHAVMFHDGDVGMVDLNTLIDPTLGWTLIDAVDIAGDYVVGSGERNGKVDTFRLHLSNGVIDDISSGWPGFTVAGGVNQFGDVVGWGYLDTDFNQPTAYVYSDRFGFKKLDDLTNPGDPWNLQYATGINDAGQIVGQGLESGMTRAFELSVAPQAVACGGASNMCGGTTGAVCLWSDGVVDLGNGKFAAVFGVDNSGSASVHPTTNEVRLDGTLVSNPQPAPPAWLAPGNHPGVFLPTFSAGHTIAWTVDGQTVSASSAGTSRLLPKVPIGTSGYGVMIDGTLVTIQPDLAAYAGAPDQPSVAPDRQVGAAFNGTISGKLTVTPTGAAVYTVPIARPPSIGGMAPDLSLVYNSQAGDGIAGQGWSLSGLSNIHRCPKTRVQDGYSRPVHMNNLLAPIGSYSPPNRPPITFRDGLCLDGRRMFERDTSQDAYYMENDDQSTIAKVFDDGSHQSTTAYFKVVTKTGETRFYGSRSDSRVFGPSEEGGASAPEIGIWALDTVVDPNGNYYEIHYNDDHDARGLLVAHINYSGHLPGDRFDPLTATRPTVPSVSPPNVITFNYDPQARPDVRHSRLGPFTLPLNRRLHSITTPMGSYELVYESDDDPMLPSRVSRIKYCATPSDIPPPPAFPVPLCAKDLEFHWEGGGYHWEEAPDYALPAAIGMNFRTRGDLLQGTQFVDLDGDGRPDFIQSKQGLPSKAWHNTGHGWEPADDWALPVTSAQSDVSLVKSDGTLSGSSFADVDGDGMLDFVAVTGVVCDPPPPNCTPFVSPGCIPRNCSTAHPAVWFNRIKTEGRWVPDDGAFGQPGSRTSPPNYPSSWGDLNFLAHDALADMNGDGRADLIRMGTSQYDGEVLLSTPDGWAPAVSYNGASAEYHPQDVNRDGLADLVGNVGGPAEGTYLINIGSNITGTPFEPFSNPSWKAPPGTYLKGDVDGDGLFDTVGFSENWTPTPVDTAVRFGTGGGFTTDGTAPYLAAMAPWDPGHLTTSPARGNAVTVLFSMADLNGDGLADLIVPTQPGQQAALEGDNWLGKVLVNSGTTWNALPVTNPSNDANLAPTIPFEMDPGSVSEADGAFGSTHNNGAAFVDLDGDGITDLVWSEVGVPTGKAWLNKFQRPTITKFPNALAPQSTVAYVVTTAESGSSVYKDDAGPPVEGTTYMATPMTVVASVTADDGLGYGGTVTTSYGYRSMRASSSGRGPQGFKTTIVTEPSGETVTTTHLQAFPYTGLPSDVSRTRLAQGTPVSVSDTATLYCDHKGAQPSCTPNTGPSPLAPIGPGTSLFVYPIQVADTAYVHSGYSVIGSVTTTTVLTYDAHNNLTNSSVEVSNITDTAPHGETYSTVTTNTYGSAGSDEERLGKLTRSEVQAQRLVPAGPPRKHVTEFRYGVVSSFGTYPTGSTTSTRDVLEKIVEPGAGWPIELHTAYAYDGFGHVITTTTCANDYAGNACVPGAQGPLGSSDPSHLPFRTTTISYDPGDFNAPPGADLVSSLGYPAGYFPVKTTNAAGHTEYFAYDAVKGVLLQKTDPNGVNACFKYDDLGRQTLEIDRCGSAAPIATGTSYHEATAADPFPSSVVTTTTHPDGQMTWTYGDVFGRKISAISKSFSGSYNETYSIYDALGRLARTAKPRESGQAGYFTTTSYDDLGRVYQVDEEMAPIDGTGFSTHKYLNTTYFGYLIQTDQVFGQKHETRTESKNILGKTFWIQDAAGTYIFYDYDADGNVLSAGDPFGVTAGDTVPVPTVWNDYDTLGRKIDTTDPDMGFLRYDYNPYGEMIDKTDASHQTTAMTYDALGRITTQLDALGQSQWIYDAEAGGIGKLSAMVSAPDDHLTAPCDIPHATLTDGNRAGRSFSYDQFGQVQDVTECVDGQIFVTSTTHDPLGRQQVISYPYVAGNRLSVESHYTSLGYLHFLSDTSDNQVYWTATAMNALGQVTREVTRNGVETISNRNASTGWLMSSSSVARGDSGAPLIQGFMNQYDQGGNLTYRAREDGSTGTVYEETFEYDLLNRLTAANRSIPGQSVHTRDEYHYDILGNLTKKGDTDLSYGGCGAGPHAACTAGNASYSYDENGNMLFGGGRSFGYNPSHKPIHIESAPTSPQGNDAGDVDFVYGADGNRVVQIATPLGGDSSSAARTIYVGLGGTGKSLYERTTSPGKTEHVHYLYAGAAHGGSAFALRVVTEAGASAATTTTKYNHFDHLGSVTAMSDDAGHVITPDWGGPDATVMDYDPWGARRQQNGQPSTPASFNLQVGHREFTGHETLPAVGLVNMNGRLYDPALGRFVSPDPTVQFEANLQSFNRYSYVLNNPLSYTDPTGFQSVTGSDTGDTIVGIVIGVVAAVGCDATAGVGCVIFFAFAAAVWNTAVMEGHGASFDQILAVNVISLGFASLDIGLDQDPAGAGAFKNDPIAGLLYGAGSSALKTAMTDVAVGNLPGEDVLVSAATGAAKAAVAITIKNAIAVSDADKAKAEADAQDSQASGAAARHASYIMEARAAKAAGDTADWSYYRTSNPWDTTPRETVADTVYVGGSFFFKLGFHWGVFGGFAIDDNGQIAVITGKQAAGIFQGGSASLTLQVQFSNAKTVQDLGGPFWNISGDAGRGPYLGIDGFGGASDNGYVHGFGAEFGIGGGESSGVGVSNTTVTPIGSPIFTIPPGGPLIQPGTEVPY